jgi:hypothetical protein
MSGDALLRAALLAAIGFYRRRLSGRGPFARCRCTFGQLESCSAFGERTAREAPSTPAAVRRIVRRLVRCRDLSLFHLEDGGLGGGRGYDALLRAVGPAAAVRALDGALVRDGESSAVRAAVGRAVALVAAAQPVRRGPASAPALLIRDAAAVRRALRCRRRSRAAVALAAGGLGGTAALAGCGAFLILPLFLTAVLAAVSARAARRRLGRLERLELFAALEGPLPECSASRAGLGS